MERVGIALGIVVAACGGDHAQSGDGSSSSSDAGPSSSATVDPTTVGGPDSSGSSSSSSGASSESTASGDDTTTGGTPTGHARFIVRERIGIYELIDPVVREYDEGTLSEPVALVPDLPVGSGVVGLDVDENGEQLVYCVSDLPDPGVSCAVRDLSVDPPGPSQPFAGDALPTPLAAQTPDWIAPANRYFFRAAQAPEGGQASLMRASYDSGVLGECEALVALPDGYDFTPGGYSVSSDGTTVLYVAGPDGGPNNAYVVALAADLPAVPTAISDIVDPALSARDPGFLEGANAVVYGVGGTSPIDPNAAYYLVDLAAPAPAGVRIDDPSAPELERAHLQSAPDGHALVYWVGDGLAGDIVFVELDGLAPPLPITVSTLGAAEAFATRFGWSPDSRWVTYLAEHDQPDTRDMYLVDASGASPSAPIA